LLRELGLTEEQREEMHALADPSSRETFERATQMRNALNEAVENGENESAIRQYAYELGMAEGDAAVARARTHAQVMQILTDEQREKYRALKAERKQKMEERKQRFEERRSQRRERNPDSF
jgi:Spy/CpxP family protein refolding chaperone